MPEIKYVGKASLEHYDANIKEYVNDEITGHSENSSLHVTSTNASNLKSAYDHSQSAHARVDATNTAKSSTNGNILINGTETVVYMHPSGTNPHGTTKNDIGLGNVNNTSDANKPVSTAQKEAIDAVQTNVDAVQDELTEHINNDDIHFTADERTKLSGIATGANKYTHPSSGVTAGTYKSVTVNEQGHVTAGTNPTTLAGYGITDADSKGAADIALATAKSYTDTKISNLINSAPTTLDTLGEIASAMEENADVVEALEEAVGTKANSSDLTSHTSNTSNPHNVTKSQIGLGSVENKSSATIRGEITSSNVTTALGYTPYTPAEVDEKLDNKVDAVSGKGLSTNDYTTTEKTKLSGIATGAEVNQNAFSNIKVGDTTVAADAKTDTLTLAGSNVTITPDATNDKITFAVADGSTSAKGLVQLTNSTSSTSTTTAATPSSVKSAYDLANTAKTNAATAQTKADSAYTLAESKVDSLSDLGITATATELNYMDGVTSNVQTQLDGKAPSSHTSNKSNPHGVTLSQLGVNASSTELNRVKGVTSDVQTQLNAKAIIKTLTSEDLNSVIKEGFYNAGGGNTITNKPSGVDHFGMIVTHNAGGTYHTQILMGSDGKQWRRTCTNGTWGNWSVDKLTDTTYSAAGSSLGLVKSGGDVTISSGVITVNDDSHNHTIANIDNLQGTLDGKQTTITGGASTIASSNLATNRALISNGSGKVAVSAVTSTELGYLDGVTSNIQSQLDGKASSAAATTSANGLMSAADKTKLDGIATGANKYSLPTAASGTLGGIKTGYSASGKNYAVQVDSSGNAYVNVPWTDNNTTYTLGSFGLTATAAELNYCDGVTSNIQTQLNSKMNKMNIDTTPTSSSENLVYSYGVYQAINDVDNRLTENMVALENDLNSQLNSHTHSNYAASSHNHAASEITSGTLGVARGGTGATTLTSGYALIGNGTSAVTTRAITNNTTATYIDPSSNLITANTLAYWNGTYNSSNSSKLAYCNRGAFGTIVTKGSGDYLPISGGTLTGSVTVSYSGTTESKYIVTNSLRKGSFVVSSIGRLGIYDNTNNKWMFYSETAGDTVTTPMSLSAATGSKIGVVNFGDVSATINVSTATQIFFKLTNSKVSGSYVAAADGYMGLHDSTNSQWVLCHYSDGTIYLGNSYKLVVPTSSSVGIRPNTSKGCSLGHSSYLWSAVYGASSAINTSDRNQKKDERSFDIDENYKNFFFDLKPTIYKFIDGTSGRDHFGFISQDVEESLYKFGFNDKSFGGFCKDIKVDGHDNPVLDENGDVQWLYALRYEEFISLNTYMIQKLYEEKDALKEENTDLKSRVEKLEELVTQLIA